MKIDNKIYDNLLEGCQEDFEKTRHGRKVNYFDQGESKKVKKSENRDKNRRG